MHERQVKHIHNSVGDKKRARGEGNQAYVLENVTKLWPLVSVNASLCKIEIEEEAPHVVASDLIANDLHYFAR